jgi:hypothetical protein
MTHNRASLGKRPRAEYAEEPTPETHRPHVGYTPSSDAARHAEDTHNSPSRHTPGITPGAFEARVSRARHGSVRTFPESTTPRVPISMRH